MRCHLSGRKRALRCPVFLEERCSKLSRAAPFPRPNSKLSTGFAKFLHQHREKTAFQRAVFSDLVSQLRKFGATALVLDNYGPFFLGADIPLGDGLHKRALKKPNAS